MNTLIGTISQITTAGTVNLADIDVNGIRMAAIILGNPQKLDYLGAEKKVAVWFNESEVSLGQIRDGQISLNNQLPCTVAGFVSGEILTQVNLLFGHDCLTALITTRSVVRLGLKVGDGVTAFIKATEVLLKAPEEGRDAD